MAVGHCRDIYRRRKGTLVMGVQILKTDTGDELVVLSRREYDALLARAGDEEAEDRMTLVIAAEARGEEPLPQSVSTAVLAGDSLLKSLRAWRGLTQADIASASGLNQGYVSELENGSKTGTPESLTKLAAALSLPARWLV
jgi:DNA-binding XRE family transcriptional regulator